MKTYDLGDEQKRHSLTEAERLQRMFNPGLRVRDGEHVGIVTGYDSVNNAVCVREEYPRTCNVKYFGGRLLNADVVSRTPVLLGGFSQLESDEVMSFDADVIWMNQVIRKVTIFAPDDMSKVTALRQLRERMSEFFDTELLVREVK